MCVCVCVHDPIVCVRARDPIMCVYVCVCVRARDPIMCVYECVCARARSFCVCSRRLPVKIPFFVDYFFPHPIECIRLSVTG